MVDRIPWCGRLSIEVTMPTKAQRIGRAVFLATDDPHELPPPRLEEGMDAGWAVAELFEAAWVVSGRDPDELRRSVRSRGETGAW